MSECEERMSAPDFWDDRNRAGETTRALSADKRVVEEFGRLRTAQEDAKVLLDMALEGGEDPELEHELKEQLERLAELIHQSELKSLLSSPEDPGNAILTIHPGAGGTESQDWAEMLLRMYQRWAEARGFQRSLLDLLAGDEAGIKSVTLEIRGPYAYGLLKAESGVHRLVRISPFDAAHRRHTSFASVFVYPEPEEIEDVEIQESEIRIDTFRASGAGGQHVNKTDSAVRITHIPTGITVSCQSERSQHRNRANALKVLQARLMALKIEEEDKKRAEQEEGKKDIAWGNQIRSYVFQPYTLVKDHRTGEESGNVQAVMDGGIDRFIDAFLRLRSGGGGGKKG
ncbi:MAG: peptide chain release factor 2 [Candidatus Eisenbacteria bacterium]|nr:peptide chain release factor 2 [Candidatus Eisenbacteria bacterium]